MNDPEPAPEFATCDYYVRLNPRYRALVDHLVARRDSRALALLLDWARDLGSPLVELQKLRKGTP